MRAAVLGNNTCTHARACRRAACCNLSFSRAVAAASSSILRDMHQTNEVRIACCACLQAQNNRLAAHRARAAAMRLRLRARFASALDTCCASITDTNARRSVDMLKGIRFIQEQKCLSIGLIRVVSATVYREPRTDRRTGGSPVKEKNGCNIPRV